MGIMENLMYHVLMSDVGTPESLGMTIKALRERRSMSQQVLADLIGGSMTQSDVSNLERGKVKLPRKPRLDRIAEIFNISTGELLARSGWTDADYYVSEEPAVPHPELQAIVDRLLRVGDELSENDLKVLRAIVSVYEAPIVPAKKRANPVTGAAASK